MDNKHDERHYYLYAKGHYREESLEMDLRKIQSHYCSVPAKALSIHDVNSILVPLAYSHIGHEQKFVTFIDYIGVNASNLSFGLAVAHACLITLGLTKVTEIPFTLGEADPEVLPLKRGK